MSRNLASFVLITWINVFEAKNYSWGSLETLISWVRPRQSSTLNVHNNGKALAENLRKFVVLIPHSVMMTTHSVL